MNKMLGKIKKFGRCNVAGHGGKCEVSDEIQSTPITRTEEKREWLRDATKEIDAMSSEEFERFLEKSSD